MKEITKLAPRIATKSADWYKQNFTTLNAGAEYTLEAIPQIYRLTMAYELKGKFSRGELMLMIDVNNGLVLTSQSAGQHIKAQVSDGIALDHLDEKWKVDGAKLNKKVDALTFFQSFCLEIWILAYWENHEKLDMEKYVKEMVGGMEK